MHKFNRSCERTTFNNAVPEIKKSLIPSHRSFNVQTKTFEIKMFHSETVKLEFADFGNLEKMGKCRVVSFIVLNWLSLVSGTV